MTIQKLNSLGQSLWYDNIQRRLLENGEMEAMINCGDIRGVTSNPSIYPKCNCQNDRLRSGARPAGLVRLGF